LSWKDVLKAIQHMEKEFFYLDGKEQKGPFTKEQLLTVGLKPDTLVWTEGFENWKPLREVEELKVLLKKTQPPPPPIFDNSPPSTIPNEEEALNEKKIVVEDSNFKLRATLKIYATAFLLLVIVILSAFLLSNNKKQKMKEEIYAKVNNIMDGKTVVLDGIYFKTEGELQETGLGKKAIGNSNQPIVGPFEPRLEKEKLYAIYTAYRGGFTIKTLTRLNDDGFDIVTKKSLGLGYKMSLSTYTPPSYWDDGFDHVKINDGYSSSNYPLSIDEYYLESFEYFTKEDRESPGAYSHGKYVDITNLPDIRNDYFFMDNTIPKNFSSSGVQASSWESDFNISNNKLICYFKSSGKHYEITENKEAINNDLLKYLLIPIASLLLFLLLTLFSKPKYFRNLNLYGKRWENTSCPEQIFFFEHSFLGNHTFIEINNDKVFRGILKITDKGNTLNLSYPNKELFYKIDKIDLDNLYLISFKDKINVSFVRIGANQNSLIKSDIESQS
jgi:hypothetical protein